MKTARNIKVGTTHPASLLAASASVALLASCGLGRGPASYPNQGEAEGNVGISGSSGLGARALDRGLPPSPTSAPAPSGVIPVATLPSPPTLACASTLVSLRPGQSSSLLWSVLPAQDVAFEIAGNDGMSGTVSQKAQLEASYAAPASLAVGRTFEVKASLKANPGVQAACRVKVLGNDELFSQDQGQKGLVGNVFPLPRNTARLPNLDALASQSAIVSPNLDVSTRSFSSGFPGVQNLVEWFAIRFKGRLAVSVAGRYEFRLNSDDGSNLYVNGSLVIDNDGTHSTQARDGSTNLVAGDADLRIDYFQGPADQIALQLFWKIPGAADFVIIPPDVLRRPL